MILEMIPEEVVFSRKIETIRISSSVFQGQSFIPKEYTCDGKNINPALHIKDIPKETKSLALIMYDSDSPIRPWVHWLVWNIPPSINIIKKNSIPGTEGLNDFGQFNYGGPCPISGIHHYNFKIYALDDLLYLRSNTMRAELERAMIPHILGSGEIIGLYKRELNVI